MGREATVHAEVGTAADEVGALLESTELILRGAIRRRFAKAAITQVSVRGGVLRFNVDGEQVALHLGDKAAQAWADAIAKPPPSLRKKLGLDDDALAFLAGQTNDGALIEAIDGRQASDLASAAMLLAIIESPTDLAVAIELQATTPGLPIWAIYPKGRAAAFGDTPIRSAMREAGFRDTKSCAVSDRLTATRYNPT
ncbi:hypothetical protein HGI47_12065 [Novosphingobium sp. ERN07]|uniref:hypothetical protein n=1 Tax=Novosphingobium sp. ERN07 TaxID=2726187 RepID=UPI0014563202|nr:hypothetical protein [Novosphingobium sp. ERN07]NLR71607.1 hypothetical protein [Novosphingobium sp. ERN07]